ncbi:RNA polymerase sigma factor [Castellaniella sp.]|uniref:RNA polymerase sigma factor n=1 Tax=Castellaniella sp. TaxID=1955812 RepID=UPI00356701C8
MDTLTEPAVAQDIVLFQQAAEGDLAAFNQLMRRYNQRLYRSARSILHNEMDAEEAVQEAWWKAYNHLQDFRAEARPTTWLTRIVVNEALMRLRRNKSREAVIQLVETDSSETPMSADFPDVPLPADMQPEHQVWRAELRALIEQQIDALPDLYRAVFMLRGVEGLSSAEVAVILDIPETTVRVRYMRARQQLQWALKAPFNDSLAEAFSFAGERCDRIVAGVHRRMREAGILQGD